MWQFVLPCPRSSPELAPRVKSKVEVAVAYRTYQGSKNLAKAMLHKLGAWPPLKRGLNDQARVDSYNATLEDLTQCIRENGADAVSFHGVDQLVLNSHGYRRWMPVDIEDYRQRKAG